MTNEQAIKILYSQWQEFLENNIDYAGISDAYKMAIKALEAWQKVKEELKEEMTGLDMFVEKKHTIRWVLRVIDNALGEVGERK